MAARQMVEDETVLSLDKIKKLFNQFCRRNHKPFSTVNIDAWIVHREAKNRLFGVSPSTYRGLTGTAKSKRRDLSTKHFAARFDLIFQRRHDCIHNCDRPKVALTATNLNSNYIGKVIYDVDFLVSRFAEAVTTEFPRWLRSLAASPTTCARVLQ